MHETQLLNGLQLFPTIMPNSFKKEGIPGKPLRPIHCTMGRESTKMQRYQNVNHKTFLFPFKSQVMDQSMKTSLLILLATLIGCQLIPISIFGQRPLDVPSPTKQEPVVDQQEPVDPDSPPSTPIAPLPPTAVRLHLWDGTVVGGNVTFEQIDVATQFGSLRIPIANIVRFRPGLDSFPAVDARIKKWIEQLGDRDFATREQAHRELSRMGLQLKSQISKFDDGGSAERKKHLAEIRQEIEQLLDEDSMSDSNSAPLIRQDTIETSDFTIVGKIQQESFTIVTKHGALEVGIADIKMGDRTWLTQAPTLRKTVEVKGNSFFQTEPTPSGLRVNRGDRISIRAAGTVSWANWGSISSTPDGITNQGQWNGINCGKLIARIGKSGKNIAVGSQAEFVATSSGVLYLAVAMQDNYASQKGYNWPGEYRAKISVQPASR